MSAPIFEHRKRGGARFIVQHSEYRGSHFIDRRAWVEADGNLKATKKGCTIPPDVAPALAEALLRASDEPNLDGRT